MKTWHWGCIAVFVIAYLVGVKYPSPGQMALGKIGL